LSRKKKAEVELILAAALLMADLNAFLLMIMMIAMLIKWGSWN